MLLSHRKTTWYWHKPKKCYPYLIFDKGAKNIDWRKDSGAGKINHMKSKARCPAHTLCRS